MSQASGEKSAKNMLADEDGSRRAGRRTSSGFFTGPGSVLLYSLAGVIAVVITAFLAINILSPTTPYYYPEPWETARDRSKIEARCLEHVSEAERRAAEAITLRAEEFVRFIESSKAGAEGFSKAIVSYRSKWRAVKPYLPYTDKNGHRIYITEIFEEHIFSQAELAAALERTVYSIIRDLEGIENDLAVALRQEILGRSLAPGEIMIAEKEFKRAIGRMLAASQWDATKSAGKLGAIEISTVIGTRIAAQLAVSTGFLAAGAANSLWTLGFGVAIGITLDLAWNYFTDPAGKIEQEIKAALDHIASNASAVIIDEMHQVIEIRGQLWNETIKEMLP